MERVTTFLVPLSPLLVGSRAEPTLGMEKSLGKLAVATGDTTARSGGTPPVTTARSQVSARSGAGRSDAGMSNIGGLMQVAPLGTFLGTEASDDAKAMWSAYRSQLHSHVIGDGPPSLGLMSTTAGGVGQRLQPAPNLPKLGGPDDPGRLVKDWQYYCYHPAQSLHSSLNQYGTSMNSRWPGLNHTPVTRHHLVLRPGSVGASRELSAKVWTGHPSMEAGPGEQPIIVKMGKEEVERKVAVDAVERHREQARRIHAARVVDRTRLQMMASQHIKS